MKKTYRNHIVFAVCIVIGQVSCMGSFFQMQLDQASIYSPSTLVINTQLTEKANLQGKWRVDLRVYANKELIRKQTLPISQQEPAVFKVEFPELRGVIRGRCRSELFLDDQFIAGLEKKIGIWPRPTPYTLPETNKTFWAYDTSGNLQKIFKSIEVKAVDATFKTARDFSKPDIIFIGENTDPNHTKVISKHLLVSGLKPVIPIRSVSLLDDAVRIIHNNRPKSIHSEKKLMYSQLIE